MTTKETRRYEMLVRVRDFGAAHRDRFPESSVGGQAFATVTAAVGQLSVHAVSKMSSAREGKGKKTMAREALVDRLEAISRTARVIAEEAPGFADRFRLLRRRLADQTLLTTGKVFLQDAEAAKDRFVGHGMPEAFVPELTELVGKFEQAIRGREAGKTGQTAAQAGIEAALESGLAAVRKLDVIVENQLHADPVVIAVWERDRRIDDRHRARSVAAAPALEPVAPAITSPTPQPVAAPAAEPKPPTVTDVNLKVAS